MPNIIYVPVEPLEERYTEQWYRKFPEAFRKVGYSVRVIDGIPLLDNEIKIGTFLDINSTIHYKMTQLQAIAKMFQECMVPDGTIFFFGDIEFWGIESVRLLADMNKVRVYLTGFLHAASYTKEDAFSIAAPYQQYTEVGWLAAFDKVFVGSEYHKQAFIERRMGALTKESQATADKIVVTKNPIFLDEYYNHAYYGVDKQKKVLLTNRFDQEKRPEETLELFQWLHGSYSDWEFVVTTGRPHIEGNTSAHKLLERLVARNIVTVKAGLTKDQYHLELAEAYMVVSHSIEENYGYCVAESIHYGCVPLLREGMSHNEFVSDKYRFHTHMASPHVKSDYKVAKHWMDRFGEPMQPLSLDTNGMQNIINELKARNP